VTAINADDGTVKWKYDSPTPMVAGITATGGGLVFTADLNGDALAINAADGKVLWKQNTGAPVGGGVITYLAGGKQYVALATGHHVEELADECGKLEDRCIRIAVRLRVI
jgi:alcohol dehydrogenase (cytochrome c)